MTKMEEENKRRTDLELRKWCVGKAQELVPGAPVREIIEEAGIVYQFVTAGGEFVRDASISTDSVGFKAVQRKPQPEFCPDLAAQAYENTASKVQSIARRSTASEEA